MLIIETIVKYTTSPIMRIVSGISFIINQSIVIKSTKKHIRLDSYSIYYDLVCRNMYILQI